MILSKSLVATAAVAIASACLGAAQVVEVNDLLPYDNQKSDSFWKTTDHPYVSVTVTQSAESFSPAALLPSAAPAAMAVDTCVESEGSAFLDILSTISPGFSLILK